MERLEKQFYEIQTLELAEKLLGKIFVHILPENMIGTSVRVGISKSRELPWRKFISGNPHVSKVRFPE